MKTLGSSQHFEFQASPRRPDGPHLQLFCFETTSVILLQRHASEEGSCYQRELSGWTAVVLKQLSAATGETASFYVRQNDKRIALFRAETASAVRAAVQIGQGYAITQGASGKVLLAFSGGRNAGYAEIRNQLWAVSYGERDPETASVAAPCLWYHRGLAGRIDVIWPP